MKHVLSFTFTALWAISSLFLVAHDAQAQTAVTRSDGQVYYYYPDGSVEKGPGMINNNPSSTSVTTNNSSTVTTTPKKPVISNNNQNSTNVNNPANPNGSNQAVINPGSVTQVIPGVVTYTPAQSYGYGVPAVTVVNPYYNGYIPTNNTGVIGYGLGYVAGAK
jgi:hypothetical protein